MINIEVLGPIRVSAGGESANVVGGRQRRVVVALAIAGPEGCTHDELGEVVWDEAERPADQVAHLRTIMNRLRTQLRSLDGSGTEVIATRPGGYAIDPDNAVVDLWRFAELLDRSDDEIDPVHRETLLQQAVDMWRGAPFDECGDLVGFLSAAQHVSDRRLDAEERLLVAQLDRGQPERVLSRVGPLLERHPYRERLREAHVLALYRTGRQTEALREIAAHRQRMIEDLGVSPSPEIDAIEQSVLQHDPAIDGPTAARRSLRGYQLDEVIGSGAHSVVYRGVQPTLGRPVAIKVVRQEIANDINFIRGFEREASIVARLEHPHIIPLFDYWREPNRAFLVTRLLPRSLADRLRDEGPCHLDMMTRIVRQVGGALVDAHRRGVVHRDVKPANVLLDADDNAFLSDFGIAYDSRAASDLDLDALTDSSLSPEQLTGQTITESTDVWGLAILVLRMATGETGPIDDVAALAQTIDGNPGVRTWLLAILTTSSPEKSMSIKDCLNDLWTNDGSERSASDTVHQEIDTTWRPGTNTSNPYRGLQPFDRADADVFSGRDSVVDVLSRHWAEPANRVLALVGASGSGKSSLVRAGFVPALERGVIDGSDRWYLVVMTPGDDPFAALSEAISSVSTSVRGGQGDELLGTDPSLIRALDAAIPDKDTQLVIVIDQMEELFATPARESAAEFLDVLAEAVASESPRVRVVVTLRADQLDQALGHRFFTDAAVGSVVPVGPMAPAELALAITAPAAHVDVQIAPDLVGELIADVARNPNALPLLQLTLTDLFERRSGNSIHVDDYRRIGGLAGALVSRGEQLIEAVPTTDLDEVRRLFSGLVTIGAGETVSRRRIPLAQMYERGVPKSVVDAAIDARLVVLDRDTVSREPTLEIAHEAVLGTWPLLADWLAEDRDLLREHASLSFAADSWDREQRDPAGLLRGSRLDNALMLAAAPPVPLSEAERALVDESDRLRADEQHRRRRRRRAMRALTAAAVAVAVIACVAGVIALRQRDRAEAQSERAVVEQARASAEAAEADRQRSLADDRATDANDATELAEAATSAAADSATEAVAALETAEIALLASAAKSVGRTDPVLARHLAVAATARSDEPMTRRALLEVLLAESRLVDPIGSFGSSLCSTISGPSGGDAALLLVSADPLEADTRVARIHRASSGDVRGEFNIPSSALDRCPIASPDGRRALVVANRTLDVYSVDDGTVSLSVNDVDLAMWSEDGSTIVVVVATSQEAKPILRSYDVPSMDAVLDVEIAGAFAGSPISRGHVNGDRVLLADGVPAPILVNLVTGEQRRLPVAEAGFTTDVVARDELTVAGTADGYLLWWTDNEAQPELFDLVGNIDDFAGTTGATSGPVLSPSGARVAITTSHGVEVVDLQHRQSVGSPFAAVDSGGSMHFLDESRLVVLTRSGRLVTLDLLRPGGAAEIVNEDFNLGRRFGGVGPDGNGVVTYEGTTALWVDVESGRVIELGPEECCLIASHPLGEDSVIWYSQSDRLVERSKLGSLVWRSELDAHVPEGHVLGRSPRVSDGLVVVLTRDFSVSDSSTNVVVVVDVDSGEVLSSFEAPQVNLIEIISANRIALRSLDDRARIVDRDGALVVALPSFDSQISAIAGAQNGDLLIGLADGSLIRWSPGREGAEPAIVESWRGGRSFVTWIAESESGRIAVKYQSGRITLFAPGQTQPDGDLVGASFNTSSLATIADDRRSVYDLVEGRVIEVPLELDGWIDIACRTAGPIVDATAWTAATGLESPERSPCGDA